ncbi:MAG: hypothetical protein JXR48_01670 [Candidatus Delongbacteria bacterium]|nr:hypothetical protein [Candidatus Delongbacteria bacterium]MBN2833652.1 hypothetical protein [Candidatus Delongbacteria bacterium]
MKITLTDKQIKDIAEEIEGGMVLYYNLITGEIKSLPNFDTFGYDHDLWNEEIDEIEENYRNYFKFEGFDSHESFRIMADFIYTVEDERMQEKLFDTLKMHHPFRNFKDIVEYSEYRQKWFDYKSMRYIQEVKVQIELHNNKFS